MTIVEFIASHKDLITDAQTMFEVKSHKVNTLMKLVDSKLVNAKIENGKIYANITKKGWQKWLTETDHLDEMISEYSNSNNVSKQFNILWDWTDFSLGIGVSKVHKCTGWKYCFSMNIAFFSIWIYFIKS